MRIAILLLGLAGLSACGDPVRRGDTYTGDPLIRFNARLLGAPPGYQQGDPLQPMLADVVGGSSSGDGTEQFIPRSFPHRFDVEFSLPPLIVHSNTDASTDPARVWYVEITIEQPLALIRQTGKASSVNQWIAYSAQAVRVFPFGPEGTPLDLPGGFALVRRSCVPGQLNQLAIVPNSEVIVVEPLTQDTAENEYRSRCGVPLLPARTRG